MRTPAKLWHDVAMDPRWVDAQPAMLEEIMREAFRAGFAAGADLAARSIDAHVDRIESQLALRVPPAVANGLRATAHVAREVGADVRAADRGWGESLVKGYGPARRQAGA